MSDEQELEVGQIWRAKDGSRMYRIEKYEPTHDDCQVLVVGKGRYNWIFGSYLRDRYDLMDGSLGTVHECPRARGGNRGAREIWVPLGETCPRCQSMPTPTESA